MARFRHTGAEVGSLLELGSTSVGANSTFESSTAFARSGTRSWRAHKPTTALVESAFGSYVLTASANYWVAGVLRVDSANFPDGDAHDVLQFGAAAGEFGLLTVRRVGTDLVFTVALKNAAGSDLGAGLTLANGIDVWVPFIFSTDQTGAADQAQVWILLDSSPATILKDSVIANRLSASIDSFDFGIVTAVTGAGRIFFDDLIVEQGQAQDKDNPHASWNRHLIYIEPSADNGAQGWATVGAGADHAARMADGDDATGNSAAGNGALNDLYDCTNHNGSQGIAGPIPGASIPSASFYARDQLPVGSAIQGVWTYRVTAAAANFDTNFTVPLAGVTLRTTIRNTDPAGGAWSTADIDGAQFAPRYAAGQGATTGARVNEMWGYFEASLGANLSDSITITETLEIEGRVNLSDPLSITETPAIKAKIDLMDALTFVDVQEIKAKIDLSDSAAISETQDIKAKIALTDPETISETPEIKAKMDFMDSATLIDDLSIKAKIDLSDLMSISENLDIQVFGGAIFIAIYDDL